MSIRGFFNQWNACLRHFMVHFSDQYVVHLVLRHQTKKNIFILKHTLDHCHVKTEKRKTKTAAKYMPIYLFAVPLSYSSVYLELQNIGKTKSTQNQVKEFSLILTCFIHFQYNWNWWYTFSIGSEYETVIIQIFPMRNLANYYFSVTNNSYYQSKSMLVSLWYHHLLEIWSWIVQKLHPTSVNLT